MPHRAASVRTHETSALLLRRVGYAEADLVLNLFTERLGRVACLARGARKSQRRFGGSLEPLHTLRVRLDERAGAELMTLKESAIARPRHHLTGDLDRMDAAGRALGWVRRAAPPRTPEPEVWRELTRLLDRLDDPGDPRPPRLHLAEQGLRLLGAFGWGLDLESCVRCGRPCEPHRAAMIAPALGGLVCRACGGARLCLDAPARLRIAAAAAGRAPALDAGDVEQALELVEQTLRSHAGFD